MFTYSELQSAVFSQNNNTTPGTDNITSDIINASYDLISSFLLNLYNSSWGHSIISPVTIRSINEVDTQIRKKY